MQRVSLKVPKLKSYNWSGLRVASPLDLKDLQPWHGQADPVDGIQLSVGDVPINLPQARPVDHQQQLSGNDYLFHRTGVASYWVSAGQRITMAPELGTSDASMMAFLMGRPFAALACQRGWLSLHGGCFQVGGSGAVIAAPAGTGKSTLLAALQARGHGLVSDDSAVVRFVDGAPWIWPTSQRIRLKTDAAARFARASTPAEAVRPDLDKIAVPFLTPVHAPVRLTNILFLRRDGNTPMLTATHRLEILDLLSTHLNRPLLAGLILGLPRRFELVARLAERVDCHHLTVPNDLGRLDEVAAMISARFA